MGVGGWGMGGVRGGLTHRSAIGEGIQKTPTLRGYIHTLVSVA